MFSFLSPVTLWFTALLAIPLAIHFLGRERLKKMPFPSLLLVRGDLARSMARHRIKNWLLLALRTLLLLCLLVALTNPVLKREGFYPDAGTHVSALFHDGLYGRIPLDDGMLLENHQRNRLSFLDSLSPGLNIGSVLAPSSGNPLGSGAEPPEERFGDYPRAVADLLADIPTHLPAQAHIPVFTDSEWVQSLPYLIRALHDNSALRIAIIDYSPLASRAGAFRAVEVEPPGDSPLLALRTELSPALEIPQAEGRLQIFRGRQLLQDTPFLDRQPYVNLELPDQRRFKGKLRLEGTPTHAVKEFHFSIPNPDRLNLGHAGTTLSSLPSLGGNSFFKQVIHSTHGDGLVREIKEKNLRLLFLSNAPLASPSAYTALREYVQGGGLLILGLGSRSDISLINRHLLQPLEAGRIGEIIESNGPVSTHLASMAGAATLPPRLPAHTYLNRLFSFSPGAESRSLLSVDQAKPVVISRTFGAGGILLWLTDIDDLEWTNLGLSPVTPLLHHHFHSSHWSDAWKNFTSASDSVMELQLGPEFFPPKVTDPDGRPFQGVSASQGTLILGPFPRLGLYAIAGSHDTLHLAVNAFPSASSALPIDWDSALRPLEKYGARVQIIPYRDSLAALQDSFSPLWRALILAAILLLFAEGLVSAFMSFRRKPVA